MSRYSFSYIIIQHQLKGELLLPTGAIDNLFLTFASAPIMVLLRRLQKVKQDLLPLYPFPDIDSLLRIQITSEFTQLNEKNLVSYCISSIFMIIRDEDFECKG